MIKVKGFSNCINIRRGDKFETFDKLFLRGAKGERVSFQVFYKADKNGEIKLETTNSSLNTKIWIETFIDCKKPSCDFNKAGEYADGIIEYERAVELGITKIEADKEYAALIMLDIPKEGGTFETNVVVSFEGEKKILPVQVDSYNFELPKDNHSVSAFNIWEDQNKILGTIEEQREKYAEIYELLLDFRTNGTKLPVRNNSIDAFIQSAKKYANDERVTSYSIPYQSKREKTIFEEDQEVLDLEHLEELLYRLATESTNELNLLKKGFFYVTFIDEPYPPKYHSVRRVHDEIHDVKRKVANRIDFRGKRDVEASLLTLDNIVTVFQKEPIYGYVDTWCPFFWGAAMAEYRYESDALSRLGRKHWWYGCNAPCHPYPNFHTDSPITDQRYETWMRFNENIRGNLYWAVNFNHPYDTENGCYTKDLLVDPNFGFNSNGEGMLVYTETQYGKPFPTLRLNSYCEGCKDYEYLLIYEKLLDELSLKYDTKFDTRKILCDLFNTLFDHTVINSDYRALEYAKHELAMRIEIAQNGIVAYADENENGWTTVTVYSKQEITIKGAKLISRENTGEGVKYQYITSAKNGKVSLTYKTETSEKEFSFVVAIRENVELSDLKVENGKINIYESNAGKRLRINSFMNSESPVMGLDCSLDLSTPCYFKLNITSLCPDEMIMKIVLVDDKGEKYEMGYEMIEQNKENELYYCINKQLEKRLNNYEEYTAVWKNLDRQNKKLNDFDFSKLRKIQFIPQNNVKLLDENRERKICSYDIIFQELQVLYY